MIRTDLGLHAAVCTALRRVLGEGAERIGVVVRDGIVTLTGTVDTPHEKLATERAVDEVPGVHAVAEELHLPGELDSEPTDEMLAGTVLKAFGAGLAPIGRHLAIKVEHGWVAVIGTVASADEREAVEQALECVPGLRGITSEIRIESGADQAAANRSLVGQSDVVRTGKRTARRPRRP